LYVLPLHGLYKQSSYDTDYMILCVSKKKLHMEGNHLN
jgi:hypothetical protein